jgi:hypothetical protein
MEREGIGRQKKEKCALEESVSYKAKMYRR